MLSIENAKELYLEKEKGFKIHIDELDKRIQEKIKESSEIMEGNSFYHTGNWLQSDWFFIYKRINLLNVVVDNNIKKMIEIGFNGGHSAVLFLSVLPQDGEICFFDLNKHSYVEPCYSYLKSKFPQMKELISGDSRKTLPKYIQENPDEVGKYDCVHVDGGHTLETVLSDIAHSDILLKNRGIMILDDMQTDFMSDIIKQMLDLKYYTFIYQIPTYIYPHCCLMKVK